MSEQFETELQERITKLGLDPTSVWQRELNQEELIYLLDQCPFIQLTSQNETAAYDEPKFITAESGWVIHDYGDALSTSPGELLFGHLKKPDDEDDDGTSGGTLIKQTYETALELIIIAKNKGWDVLRFIDGHPRMAWAVWHHGLDHNIHLSDYSPTETDLLKRERIKRDIYQEQKLFLSQSLRGTK